MYAVIRTGGKQYRVAPGDVVRIEKVTADEVQKLARQFFDPKQTSVAMLGRLEGFRVRRQDLKG